MTEIEIHIDYDRDLTVFTVTGNLKAGELLAKTESYQLGKTTKLVLIDFTKATWAGISNLDFRNNISKARKYSRKGTRNAFVFSKDVDYGPGRMFEVYVEIEQFDTTIRVFRTMKEANEWLLEPTAMETKLQSN